jgi:hypothetical protein
MLDKMPRVRLLIVSSLFMAAAVLVQSVLSAVYNKQQNAPDSNVNALRAQVAMFFVFNLFFVAVGYGPSSLHFPYKALTDYYSMLSWLIPPEMSPMIIRYILVLSNPVNLLIISYRAKVNSVSVSVNNIAGLVVAQVSPIALSHIGFKYFYIFVACDIVAAVTYFFFYPEWVERLTSLKEYGS